MRARPCLFGITPSQESESKYRVAANLGAINKYPLNIMYIERICICLMLLLWKISSIHADALILRLERTCEMEMEMEMEIEWRKEKKKKNNREKQTNNGEYQFRFAILVLQQTNCHWCLFVIWFFLLCLFIL